MSRAVNNETVVEVNTVREKNRRRRKRKRKLKSFKSLRDGPRVTIIRSPRSHKVVARIKWTFRAYFDLILIIASIFLTSYSIIESTAKDRKLADYGEYNIAQVYAKSSQQGRLYRHYKFEVDGSIYKGFSLDDSHLKVGDNILIVYLPSDPSVNFSATRVDKYKNKRQKRLERQQERAKKRKSSSENQK